MCDPFLTVGRVIGKEVIRHGVVRMDAQQMVQQVHRHAGAVLAGCAVNEARALALRERREIAAQDVVEARAIGQCTIKVNHRLMRALSIDAAFGSLKMRGKARRLAIEKEHFAREPLRAAASLLRPLTMAAQVDHML